MKLLRLAARCPTDLIFLTRSKLYQAVSDKKNVFYIVKPTLHNKNLVYEFFSIVYPTSVPVGDGAPGGEGGGGQQEPQDSHCGSSGHKILV